MYNYKHTDIACPECEHTTVEDTHHDEIFCTYCGLVIQEPTIPSISQLTQQANENDKKGIIKKHDGGKETDIQLSSAFFATIKKNIISKNILANSTKK